MSTTNDNRAVACIRFVLRALAGCVVLVLTLLTALIWLPLAIGHYVFEEESE